MWICPECGRGFTRPKQRHACGVGEGAEVLRGRSESLVALYAAIEAFAKTLGPVEFVARERYVLLRSVRIFTDLVIMKDAIRAAIHLGRRVDDPIFFKVGVDRGHVSHVAKLRETCDFILVQPYLREAYEFSLQ